MANGHFKRLKTVLTRVLTRSFDAFSRHFLRRQSQHSLTTEEPPPPAISGAGASPAATPLATALPRSASSRSTRATTFRSGTDRGNRSPPDSSAHVCRKCGRRFWKSIHLDAHLRREECRRSALRLTAAIERFRLASSHSLSPLFALSLSGLTGALGPRRNRSPPRWPRGRDGRSTTGSRATPPSTLATSAPPAADASKSFAGCSAIERAPIVPCKKR
jgi:hypothetical protein